MAPHVFRGLWCRCGAQHYQEGRYYVSVQDGSRTMLALGPFQEHSDALARVADVERLACTKYNPEGRAHWYGYGTTVMQASYTRPGMLNPELLTPTSRRTAS